MVDNQHPSSTFLQSTNFQSSMSPMNVEAQQHFHSDPRDNFRISDDSTKNNAVLGNMTERKISYPKVDSKVSFKGSSGGRELTAEEQRQKILRTIASQSFSTVKGDDSDTEVGSSPDSTSEYSSESTVRYVETATRNTPVSSTVPKTFSNQNPGYGVGIVSNGCSKVNFLGSVRGVETDDESSLRSSTSPSEESSLALANESLEDPKMRLFPPPPPPVNNQSDFSSYHSTASQLIEVTQTFQSQIAAVNESTGILNARCTLQPTTPSSLFANKVGVGNLMGNSLCSYKRNVDQSDMNRYFDQMKDKIEIPPDFYGNHFSPVTDLPNTDPKNSDDESLQEDSDTDTIVYSPSKGTEGENALCESHSVAHPCEGDTGEGITSIPFDTSASKTNSTPATGTFGTRSGITSKTQHALRETCGTLEGGVGDTGEGVTSIPLDTQSLSDSSSSSSKTCTGEPWMARVAIAHKFRIICGGLASMTHLGNINALANSDGESDETDSQELSKQREGSICRMRTFSNDETIDEDIRSIQSEEVTGIEADLFKDEDETCGSTLPYQQMIQSSCTPVSPYNLSDTSLSDYPPFTNQTFLSGNAAYLSPQSTVESNYKFTSPQSLEDITVFYQPTLASGIVPFKQSDGGQKINKNSEEQSRSTSHKENTSDDPTPMETSESISEVSEGKLGSLEPKINEAITSRINLLEDLVHRCLENDDAALNEMEISEEEGAAVSRTSLSRIGSGSRVDVRKDELRSLISDLEGIVSSMNVQTRTLSADNVAKFFEKTAGVVADHGSSSSSSMHSKEETTVVREMIDSCQSSKSQTLSEIDKALSETEGSGSSCQESAADVFHPDDQIHIKPSILKRIDHLEEIMTRCLENEDVTMNTLGSGVMSPTPMQRLETPEQHHSSKIELKDLIGNLGSLVSDLGQKFNPDNK